MSIIFMETPKWFCTRTSDIAPLRLNLVIYLEFPAISKANQFFLDSLSQSLTIGYLSGDPSSRIVFRFSSAARKISR